MLDEKTRALLSDREAWEACGAYVPKIVTNADRIRSMSDEELAKVMDMLCPPVTNCIDGGECVKCWIEWLRQPAEED